MPWAVFCCKKNKNRATDPPCLDPLDFGIGKEPNPDFLLRRGRVGMFVSKEHAEGALRTTGKKMAGIAHCFGSNQKRRLRRPNTQERKMNQPSFFGLKVGDKVFVAHQKASGSERKTEILPISKVGRKYLYIQQYGRDLPFDPATGQSTHTEHNVRGNGYGFDVFHEESWFQAEQQHLRNISELRRSLDFYAIGRLTPIQAESILEILSAAPMAERKQDEPQ